MDLYLVLIVNIAKGIIARDRVTATWKFILADILFCDKDGLFTVELIRNHEEFFLRFIFLLLTADEGNVFQPSALFIAFFVFACQFVDVFLTKQNFFLTEGDEKIVTLFEVVEFCQTVSYCGRVFLLVLLQELYQDIFALLLHLAIVSTNNSLNLGLGLGRGYKVDPRRTHML